MGRHAAPRGSAAATAGRTTSSHRAEVPARRTRLKVVLGVGALAGAVVLVLGGQGSYAFWTDQATVNSGSFSSGTLDLTVDGAQGLSTPYQKTSLTLSSMVPGESIAQVVSIANVGDASFTWVPTATTGGGLASALQVDLYLGPGTSGQASTYPRNQTCTGTKLTSGSTATQLNKGNPAQNLCVQVSLPTSTGDAFQGITTGSVTVAVAATQVIP